MYILVVNVHITYILAVRCGRGLVHMNMLAMFVGPCIKIENLSLLAMKFSQVSFIV